MVGMGDLKGARPEFPSIYLSADPAIIEGRLHAGTNRSKGACKWFWKGQPGLRMHGLCKAAAGKMAATPTGTVKAGTTHYFIDVPTTGNYLAHIGYGESSHATATVKGQKVYRKAAGADAMLTKVSLEAGKLMGERKSGVTAWRRQGKSGSAVWTEFMDDFKGGPLTLAIANFPMNNSKPGDMPPAIGPLSITIEEQKLPNPQARH